MKNYDNVNRPWPIILNTIKAKYKIICELDLLTLDQDPMSIFNTLSQINKSDFSPEEKIIVYHYDTDYYLENTGFTLTNLLRCLKFLQISPSTVLMLTNHHGIEKEIKDFFEKNFVDFDYKHDQIKIFESNHTCLQTTPDPLSTELDKELIQSPFSCLFGTKRTHRVVLLSQLQAQGILQQGLCAWGSPNVKPLPTESTVSLPCHEPTTYCLEFLTSIPFVRVNEHWPQKESLMTAVQKYGHLYDVFYQHPLVKGLPNTNKFDQPVLKNALLNVVVETVYQYPYPYITEKTFRPILHKRPFVLIGAPNSLKFLKSIGFKTFENYWDESYDSMQDPNDRMSAVVDIIIKITQSTVAQHQQLCHNMNEILNFNFEHYTKNYAHSDLYNKLIKI